MSAAAPSAAQRLAAFWNHPAGPKTSEFEVGAHTPKAACPAPAIASAAATTPTRKNQPSAPQNPCTQNPSLKTPTTSVHFWAPTFKWGISLANVADLQRPPEKVSLPQQCAITATGLVWSRYSLVITPKNYNLFAVNVFMAVTGIWQLTRKLTASSSPASPAAPVAAAAAK
jgi:hypothetical protein